MATAEEEWRREQEQAATGCGGRQVWSQGRVRCGEDRREQPGEEHVGAARRERESTWMYGDSGFEHGKNA